MPLQRKLRYAMVGGGPGAFIGAVHRRAAVFDGLAELVAGSFSSHPDRSAAQGRELHLHPPRAYASYEEMAEREAALPPEERIDFVSIVTPNDLHYPAACTFLKRGFHVVCDKPMTTTLDDAEALCRTVEETGLVFALTHNYSGYPMVKQARALVRDGALGEVRKVVVEYSQGWLAKPIEAGWRTDPVRAGAGALGDIGTHAEQLARYVTGLELERLLADVGTVVEGRKTDDDANLLLRYRGGVRGVMICSQISAGEENRLRLRVYGSDGALEWHQETPNELRLLRDDGAPEQVLRRGNDQLCAEAKHATRLPSGHPEGFFEAFANVYSNVERVIAARIAGESPDPLDLDFPTARDGVLGVRFIERALRSGREGRWVEMA
ncbi:MAG TPA: Gfo/Idh/MocA family oxidoreductase [Longimicrobiaceae bacterium]|nr:Gfo/Idh/MocA family oxidoreductase [Longimicrobiaceae bacterium]